MGTLLKYVLNFIVFVGLAVTMPFAVKADDAKKLSRGQTVYVPAYSHIYHGNRERPFLLAVTLSIRNVNFNNKITITRADYHESAGELMIKYIDSPLSLDFLSSTRFVVPEKDKRGGSGACFIVEWRAEKMVNPPVIESVMIGVDAGKGISFTSRGVPVQSISDLLPLTSE